MPRFVPTRLPGLLAIAGLLTACDRNTTALEIFPEFDDTYSFEAGMEGWTARALDLGDPPAVWEVARTDELADQGASSVRLRLDNVAESRVWIERRYQVAPDLEYLITIDYAFASADAASVAPWLVLAGAAPHQPVDAADLTSGQDSGNGSAADVGQLWSDRTRTVITRSSAAGEIFVYLGIWGRSAGSRSYHLDDVRLTLTRRGISTYQPPL